MVEEYLNISVYEYILHFEDDSWCKNLLPIKLIYDQIISLFSSENGGLLVISGVGKFKFIKREFEVMDSCNLICHLYFKEIDETEDNL